MARTLVVVVAIGVAGLFLAAPAWGDLRSTRLESSCASGYTYGEHVVGSWTVEGCAKSATPQGDERERWLYDGDVEASGLKIEEASGSNDLVATEEEAEEGNTTFTVGRLKRTASTRLVVDPTIGGSRREFTLYTGNIDLEAQSNVGMVQQTELRPGQFPRLRAAGLTGAKVDIPVSGTPSLLGLRVRETIEDAEVTTENLTLEPSVSLGSAASNLIDDFVNTNSFEITLDDGGGMQLSDLRFRIRDIAIEGIGGLENFVIDYSSSRDSWSGSVELDMGSLFPVLEFETEVAASNGAILYIRAAANNLNIPIGSTGIVLDAVEAAFGLEPLFVEAGVGVTAGPTVAGVAIIKVNGSLRIELEPNFRLEASGSVRLLPSGNGELARGDMEFIYDADGYISLGGDAYFEAAVLDVGIGASIGGRGEYSTTQNKFNIEAHATGSLLLGPFGSVDIVRLEAVVSNNGWGTCGEVLLFLSAGVGQEWDRGINLIMGCDLSRYDANVSRRAVAAGANFQARPFRVPDGTGKIGVDVTAEPGARVALRGPGGDTLLISEPGMRGAAGDNAVVMAAQDGTRHYIAVRDPQPGRWSVVWESGAPQVTNVEVARTAPPLQAVGRVRDNRTDPPGQRHLVVRRTSPLAAGETLQAGIRTSRGIRAVGDPSAAPQFEAIFDEVEPGPHEIVAIVLRDGVPVPQRRAVIGTYNATLPPAPRAVRVRRRGRGLKVLAIPRRRAELPDGWAYVFRTPRGGEVFRAGGVRQAVTVFPRPRTRRFGVAIRPIVDGRVLRTAPLVRTARVPRPPSRRRRR